MIHPLRIAHRGASGAGLAPENTLAAFERAIQIGVDAVELDVRSTRDGSLVVLHDPLLDRTTDREGPVRELSLEQVREADAGGWFGPEFAGQKVPTLAEALDLMRRRALVVIEIKADHLAEAVLRVVDDLEVADQVVIQSFSSETVRRVKAIDPAAPTALLVENLPTSPSRMRARRMVREVLSLGANILNIWHADADPGLLRGGAQARTVGLDVDRGRGGGAERRGPDGRAGGGHEPPRPSQRRPRGAGPGGSHPGPPRPQPALQARPLAAPAGDPQSRPEPPALGPAVRKDLLDAWPARRVYLDRPLPLFPSFPEKRVPP